MGRHIKESRFKNPIPIKYELNFTSLLK